MSFNLAVYLAQSVGGVGVLGGVVGGAGALAKNIQRKEKCEIDNREMLADTGKEAVGAGIATAFSAFSAGVVGGGLVVSLGTAFIAGAVGKYACDRGMEYLEREFRKKRQSELAHQMDEVYSSMA
ncbi:MAG: magnetosome protein MamC [Magnetococcales bacterium]|nr:magnetosome protein MamC [Magnetococcales bacterium]